MLKEISAPNGAEMDILQTMCVKEVWGAELQEKEVMVIREKDRALMEAVGEREKVAVMYAAGFEPWGVYVRDLLNGRITLEGFRGIVLVGGFSYADVLESVRGWRTVGITVLRLSSFDGHYP